MNEYFIKIKDDNYRVYSVRARSEDEALRLWKRGALTTLQAELIADMDCEGESVELYLEDPTPVLEGLKARRAAQAVRP